jgi:hypothetical protein
VRILVLGSSNDTGSYVLPHERKHVLAGERLSRELGEPVEFIVKGIWPTEDLSERIRVWVAETEPDLVYLNTGSYWFLYRSVPLRVRRLFRPFRSERLSEAGARVAATPRGRHNRMVRPLRKALHEIIGGDTHFTTEQVIDRISESIRVLARSEGTVLVVKGPHGKKRHSTRERDFRRDERERLKFHNALETLCSQLHVTYDGVGDGGVRHLPAYQRGTTTEDEVHANAGRHVYEADVLYDGIRRGLTEAGRD